MPWAISSRNRAPVAGGVPSFAVAALWSTSPHFVQDRTWSRAASVEAIAFSLAGMQQIATRGNAIAAGVLVRNNKVDRVSILV